MHSLDSPEVIIPLRGTILKSCTPNGEETGCDWRVRRLPQGVGGARVHCPAVV
jgi:hypothetical protein